MPSHRLQCQPGSWMRLRLCCMQPSEARMEPKHAALRHEHPCPLQVLVVQAWERASTTPSTSLTGRCCGLTQLCMWALMLTHRSTVLGLTGGAAAAGSCQRSFISLTFNLMLRLGHCLHIANPSGKKTGLPITDLINTSGSPRCASLRRTTGGYQEEIQPPCTRDKDCQSCS